MNNPFDLLLTDGVIDEVVGRLKSGKEAEVWLVTHAGEVVAAKVYKDRQARSFKNNVAYKEGRAVRNTRTQRAMDKGSRFGRAAAEDAWKSAEADALYKLHAEGVRVPAPVMFYEGVLLMRLVLDAEGSPAPRLIDAALPPEAAGAVYRDLRAQVVRMLCCELIHGDLSPYNVLMGSEGPTMIDFPQVISAAHNSSAEFFFRRDLDNLRHHLGGLDGSLLALGGDASEIWKAYVKRELTPDFLPSEKPQAEPRPPREPRGHEGGERSHSGHAQRSDRGGRQGSPRPGPGHRPDRADRQGAPRPGQGPGPDRGAQQGSPRPGHSHGAGAERKERQGGPGQAHSRGAGAERRERQGGPGQAHGSGVERGPRQGGGPGHVHAARPEQGPRQGHPRPGTGPERAERKGNLRHGPGAERAERQGNPRPGPGSQRGRNGNRRPPAPEVTYVSLGANPGGTPPARAPLHQAVHRAPSQGEPHAAAPQAQASHGAPRAGASSEARHHGHPRHAPRHHDGPPRGSGQGGQVPPRGDRR